MQKSLTMAEKKTEVPGIYKVSEGVLINKDNEALKAYKLRKEKDRKMAKLENEITVIKNDMQEIKELLRGLVK
jgi:hydroxyethylthiazole kinase-like sugar kinase family protein